MSKEVSPIVVNGVYINGVDKDKSWYPKLIEAKCTETKSGNLKVPEGREPIELMTSLFGAEKVAKYVTVQGAVAAPKESAAKKEAAEPTWVERTWEVSKKMMAEKKGTPAEKKHAFSVVDIGGVVHINGIKSGSTWEKKLIEAGCTLVQGETPSLIMPQGVKAPAFLNETLGKENMVKQGGYKYVHPTVEHTTVSKAPETQKSATASKSEGLRVYMEKGAAVPTMIIKNLTKDDKEAHKLIKENGGKFVADETNPHWVIVNPKVEQTAFYKQIKDTLLISDKTKNMSKAELAAEYAKLSQDAEKKINKSRQAEMTR